MEGRRRVVRAVYEPNPPWEERIQTWLVRVPEIDEVAVVRSLADGAIHLDEAELAVRNLVHFDLGLAPGTFDVDLIEASGPDPEAA